VNTEKVRGRGAASNPANRFERISYQQSEWDDPDDGSVNTVFLKDETRSIINYNDSPDVGFNASINPYRGCEHGCIYCFARPNHEYLGFSAGLDFETKILVKEEAPKLLRRELASSRWEPQVIAISGVTDAYQPVERRLQLTRRCLEVLAEFRNPVVIITKNELVTRDIDLLRELARFDAVLVFVSVTSLDSELARELEPRASQPGRRMAAIGARFGGDSGRHSGRAGHSRLDGPRNALDSGSSRKGGCGGGELCSAAPPLRRRPAVRGMVNPSPPSSKRENPQSRSRDSGRPFK
jgi:hypothetical protein